MKLTKSEAQSLIFYIGAYNFTANNFVSSDITYNISRIIYYPMCTVIVEQLKYPRNYYETN